MTAPPTIKDPNCGNCPNDQECPTYDDIKVPPDEQRRRRWERRQVTGKVGCATHPLALQVLAGQVSEELEGWAHTNAQSCLDTNGNSLFAIEVGTLKLKLAELLKGGVKKP